MGKKDRHAVVVEFTDPPPGRREYHWPDIAEQLRSRPGEWALVHRDLPSSTPYAINAGRVSTVHPDLGFRTRGTAGYEAEDGTRMTGELYMVYDPDLDLSRADENGAKK